jgi:hypothetical protein
VAGRPSAAGTNPARVSRWRPSNRFSSTVSAGISAMFWNVRATPRAAMRCGGSRVRSAPRNRIAPLAGRYAPETTLKVVDLPAPLGPITA